MTGILYIVATPIGNLNDMTARAIDTLKSVNVIACEDTRTSGKLLSFFNISTPTTAYHEHNADTQTARLIERLQSGQSVALISDAGTPLISDPGYRLVKACHDESITVVPIVGACAVIGALSVAGLPSDKFSFVGFLPAKQHGRIETLKAYQAHTETLIFYEAPHRITDCLSDMADVFGGEREATLCREISKTFETIKKLPLADLLEFVKNDSNQQRGEIVLVVAGNTQKEQKADYDDWLLAIAKELPPKKASAIVADVLGIKKSEVYDRLLILTQK
ncbi:16S rRNA (cytidine(1402)-2'-O)-methyltransferase [Moraxella bovis]|uniref:16S rRNA (cytidine(1402)-2'-O)-methyltransferase n=1 Tax=Moraxella bovis TaxID=476 RepID=UPI002226890E|nr:16S rRNA (cytidine(1402)-2'-O)-methyltransferase [Moraxella bovis]UYZ70655.1 16S rRNA (cytidine(1402)-2'-O)-methyltransferase [Moraxella bovis]UYZ73411.1 16S rRNA (cytidine(1402)-2'-O)-methyltransferase [Moraxella bovis]UZA13964.1 16S rRNA (cytidine(1402)-2'-O)-methyltransferase [Moraxella bovis]UZA27681.1 16S rRNA (cytidine(1402)-2'-O)-methyltransferase [Moraxella bovis]UZA37781.1 16S rRNA (cytidine(1402)-2'-O)-methyltransferase [Moraxella bovis]